MKVHLVLKKKWFDMIVSGEKQEEYRDDTPYYNTRIWKRRHQIESVVFHRGYTNTTHERVVICIIKGQGKAKWGAEKGKRQIIIQLAEEVQQ